MRKFLKALGVVAGFALAPLAAQAESLADALVSAYNESNLLDQNQAVLRAADEDAAIALANLRPVMEFISRGNWTEPRGTDFLGRPIQTSTSSSIDVSASVVIWAGGKGKLSLRAAREQVLGVRASLINVEQQVLLQAVSAYVDVGLQQKVVALREGNVRVITKEMRAAKDRFEVGEVTQTDVSLAEAALAEAVANLAAAKGQLMIARERYKATIGHYPGKMTSLPKLPTIPRTFEEARAVAERGHPFVIQAQHQVAAADLNVQIVATAFGPTVTGKLSVTDDLQESDTSAALGLELRQTLHSGGRNAALYRKALAGKEQAAAGLLQTVVQVSETIGQSWARLSVAQARIDAVRQQVEASQRAFDGVREEAKLGARTTLDVLNAEQDLLQAISFQLEAEASSYKGVYEVLSSMGLLTAEHLNLGVPAFDPAAYYNAVKDAPSHSAQGKALDRILLKIAD